MAAQTRTVAVTQLVDELTYLDVQGNEQPLGQIYQEIYGEGEAKRFTFKPDAKNPFKQKGKEDDGYVIGIGSANISFINPSEAQQAALDRGLQIQDVLAYKGGLQIKTHFIDPEKRIADVISFDYDFWSKQRREPGDLFAMLCLDTNLRIGHMAARYTSGIYRQVCSNGLYATLLGLPELAIRHSEWEVGDIDSSLESIGYGTDVLMGYVRKPLTQSNYLASARRILGRLQDEAAQPTGLSTEMVFLKERFPTITHAKGKHFSNYLEQIDLLLDSIEDNAPITGLQIVNAYTNAVSVERFRGSDRGAFDALSNINSIIAETVSLANMAAIFN